MAQYATKDDLNELATLVRDLQGNVTTLNDSVGELDTLVEKINHLSTLKDVTITYITEGDLLQYGSDGTWHNIQPSALGIGGGEGGGIVDTSVVKAMIKQEGSKLFLSKLYDDTAAGIITFANGFVSNGMGYLRQGIEIGHFVSGILGGSGARIDKDGRGEMTSLTLREFLEVPELRFNRVDVVSGELWNSIAFGTIEDVDLVNQIVTLKLEDGEYSGIHVNDICRGIFHNIDGVNNTETGVDENGFERLQGFTTAYFTPIEILDARGKRFRYSLKQGSTQHPVKSMKFAVYGNFTDTTRQSSSYSTRLYKRYLKGVNTWHIDYQRNIASQFGLLDGLNIQGAPNDGHLTGDGAYLTNVYMTGSIIEFTPDQLEDIHGQDAYSVSLSRTEGTVIVDNDMNIITDYKNEEQMKFEVQAWRGPLELTYDTTVNQNTYFCTWESQGLECQLVNGVFTITKITNVNQMKLTVFIHCEGIAIFKREFNLYYQLEGNSLWVTYNDNEATPDTPVGDGNSYGWHRNYTSTAIWMSTKSSRKVDEGEWGPPNRFRGASVAGKDGQYTVFCYTNSSVKPPIPVSKQIPPLDDNYTWYMYPPNRESVEVYTWMIQATVYADKSMSGWTDPIRLTGETGEDGTDGTKIEFIYTLTSTATPPTKPETSQQDDYIPFGWSDNPQGVSEKMMWEWVSQREKKAAKLGTGTWGDFTNPVVWSKWGEKGMDGDGYEYIFTRTTDVDKVPLTPASAQQNDYIPTISNGGSKDYNWSDDPKGVNEDYKAEWTCKRVRTDGVWSTFSTPALWSNWGEQGLSGGHYQYRWKISSTKPSIPTDAAASGWSTDSELVPAEGEYVWQIQRFANPDGTLTAWSNLIRITGADGKDGEDGNSIEFLYARNSTGVAPQKPNTTQQSDWTGTGPDGTVWTDNPQGVTPSLMYEYVCQRYKDKATQQWEPYSEPGIWSRYAERGKDGDGYEYIYRRFSNYVGGSSLGPGGEYYPSLTTPSSDSTGKSYQDDDFVPVNYTDNPVGPTESIRYEYMWSRKKENSTWQNWKTGALWSNWAEDGNGITTVTEYYLASNQKTGVTVSTSGWSTTVATVTADKPYLWNYEKVTFTDETYKNTDPVIIGMFSKDGVGIRSITEYYALSTSSTSVTGSWSTSVKTVNSSQKYLWNYELITYTDGTTSQTDPVVIGVYGDKGDKGDKGDNGQNGNDGQDGEDAVSINISGCPASVRSSLGYLQTTRVNLHSVGVTGTSSTTTRTAPGYWAAYYMNSSGNWVKITDVSGASNSTSFTVNWSSTLYATKFWFGYSPDSADYSQLGPTYVYTYWSQEVPVVYDGTNGADGSDADSSYTIMRDRGAWQGGVQYYNDSAVNAMKGASVSSISNYYMLSDTTTAGWDMDEWSTSVPSSFISGGHTYSYLLAYSYVTYSDGSIQKSVPFSITGYSSSGINSVTVYYATSSSLSSPSSGYSTSFGTITASTPYLHRYYEINKGGTSYQSSKECIARYQNDYTMYQNYQNLTVIDYVYYKGVIYLANYNTTSTPGPNSSAWKTSSKFDVLTVNYLLANHAKLGNFNFSNNTFTSSNGYLSMDSTSGKFKCINAEISGTITATTGKIGEFSINSEGITSSTTIATSFNGNYTLKSTLYPDGYNQTVTTQSGSTIGEVTVGGYSRASYRIRGYMLSIVGKGSGSSVVDGLHIENLPYQYGGAYYLPEAARIDGIIRLNYYNFEPKCSTVIGALSLYTKFASETITVTNESFIESSPPSGYYRTVSLPTNAEIGRVIFFLKYNAGYTNIYASGGIIGSSETNVGTTLAVKDNKPRIFVKRSDNKWQEFYCGT